MTARVRVDVEGGLTHITIKGEVTVLLMDRDVEIAEIHYPSGKIEDVPYDEGYADKFLPMDGGSDDTLP